MGVLPLWFADTGTGDGSSWANRAPWIVAGAINPIVTGHSYTTDSILARVLGGITYTQTVAHTAHAAAGAPLIVEACDTDGNPIAPPDPDWHPALGDEWDDSACFTMATTGNIVTSSANHVWWRMAKFAASGRNGVLIQNFGGLDWCKVINSTSNASAAGLSASNNGCRVLNSVVKMTGSAYNAAANLPNGARYNNSLFVGVAGSSGNRNGITTGGDFGNSSSPVTISQCVIRGFGGVGVSSGSSNANGFNYVSESVIAGCGSHGIDIGATAVNFPHHVAGCLITGNGGRGINAQNDRVFVANNRVRSNGTGEIVGLNNWPTHLNDTTSGSDADDYVDAANHDYRIKTTSTSFGRNRGVADQAASGGGPTTRWGPVRLVRP